MLRRTLILLAATAGIAACARQPIQQPYTGTADLSSPQAFSPQPGFDSSVQAAPGQTVAVLLPLTGPNAALAQAMLNAVHLALDVPGAPPLDVEDTMGTAPGAQAAARKAIGGHAGLILGPLTSAETAAVAQLARPAGVPMLAFTNDTAQAQAGVWTLGITPGQQVRRLVAAAQADGQQRFAALLPSNPLGNAMAAALTRSLADGGPPPIIRQYGDGFAQINAAARDLSGYADRRGPLDAQIKAARQEQTPEGRHKVAELSRQEVPPPPFDTLMLAASGEQLQEIIPLLPYYDIAPPQVHLIGPALWDSEVRRMGGMTGARYAAPDPALASTFGSLYAARFAAPPPRLADLAYDAAAIARVTALQGGFSPASLTRPDGFAGVDGVLGLQPDGAVRRGLAVFEVDHGESHIVSPAPPTLAVPGV